MRGRWDNSPAHGSGHTRRDPDAVAEQARDSRGRLDSAAVGVNASTRFHDGASWPGAELGISTDRLHARGLVA